MEDFGEIQLSGSGGQGIVLAGLILAEAAVLAGKNVVQTQSYGPEARGGATKAEVIIAEGEISYPKVRQPDLLLAMSQEAFDKYATNVRSNDGLILVDSTNVTDQTGALGRVIALPLTEMAREETGTAMTANMVALGALVSLTGIIPRKYLEEAVLARIPKGTGELNIKALRSGYQATERIGHLCKSAH